MIARTKCPLCLKSIEIQGQYLCKKCRRRYIYDERGFIRKKRNKRSPSKLQRRIRLYLIKVFKGHDVFEDVFFFWNRSDTGALLQYDLYVPDFKLLIEIQGQHHYKCVGKFHMTNDDLKRIKRYDNLKRLRALKRKFKYVTIKYDDDYISIIDNLYKKLRRNNE